MMPANCASYSLPLLSKAANILLESLACVLEVASKGTQHSWRLAVGLAVQQFAPEAAKLHHKGLANFYFREHRPANFYFHEHWPLQYNFFASLGELQRDRLKVQLGPLIRGGAPFLAAFLQDRRHRRVLLKSHSSCRWRGLF
jgi:hypothetical protein